MDERVKETWGATGPYEQYVGRWSRVIAREFLAWLDVSDGQTWSDVGCGTGALTAGILAMRQPKRVNAIDRSTGFLSAARGSIQHPCAGFAAADATALPWADGACDAAVSGLVLNFVLDALAMVKEMKRVTRTGGIVAVYVWDYSGGMQMVRRFWDAAIQVDPRAAALDQGQRFPICHPEPLMKLFMDAGFRSVAVRAIDILTIFRSFDDYWLPFLGKQGSAPAYLASLDHAMRDQIREVLKSRLLPAEDGSIQLTARAWAVRGVV